MSYATPQDMLRAFPRRDLVQLTNEDPTATSVNEAFILQYLADATLTIDAHLLSRFKLPFPDGKTPQILNKICRDLTMYALQCLRPENDVEDARKRHDDAMKMLREIRDGDLSLGLDPEEAQPAIATPTAQTAPLLNLERSRCDLSQVFSRNTMRGF